MMAGSNRVRQEHDSEPDLSDDDMGPGLDDIGILVEIQNVDAPQGAGGDAPQGAGGDAPAANQPPRKRKLRETLSSDVWKHFQRGPTQPDGNYVATCKYCGKEYTMGNQRSTSSLRHHIVKGCKRIPRSARHKPDALQRMLAAGSATGTNSVVWVFDQLRSRKNLARAVIAHDYPFNCASHHYLKVLLTDLQPEFKMVARSTLRADCVNIYEEEKLSLYNLFGNLDCRFSFTSDLWTCKGKDRGFLSLTCHYIDDCWKLRKRVISFVALPSPHTGKNIAHAILEKLVLWNLDKKAFSLVLDNASTNDACITELLSTTSFNLNLPVNGAIFHQRCGCHILNLIVQDGLGVLSDEINCVRESMKYIRNSQSRMEMFSLAANQVGAPNKKPAWDVQTRWNSTFLMLELALQLREAINRFAALDRRFSYNPSEQEWDRVKVLFDCLKPFYDATLKLSGTKYPTLNLFFPEFCEVYLSIKKMSNSQHMFVVEMGREMFLKWDKYWNISNTLLAIACVLDPRCKFDVVEYYVKEMYPEECAGFIESLKTCMSAMFNEYVVQTHSRQVQNQGPSSSQPARQPPSAPAQDSDTRAGLKDFMRGKRISEPIRSELEDYLADALDAASLDDEFDVLGWWKLKAPKYPVLSRLTRDILAVPISTVASESCFSITGRTLCPARSSLSDQSVEALICAQDWLRAEVAEAGSEIGDPLWPNDGMAQDGVCDSGESVVYE